MGFKTLCVDCANRKLVDTAAVTPQDTVMVVQKGGEALCFASENRVDPLTGDVTMPRPCVKANPSASCAWFVLDAKTAGDQVSGLFRVRGGDGWVPPVEASGIVMASLLSAKEIEANLSLEASKAPPPPPPPWDMRGRVNG